MNVSYATHAFTGELLGYDFETLAPDAVTAVALTTARLAHTGKQKAMRAFLTVEDADIRYRIDGVAPTASVGNIAYNGGAPLEIEGTTNLENLQIIATSGTAKVSVTFSRYEG